jgi:chemotaxis family two-component system response regulator Rcp1
MSLPVQKNNRALEILLVEDNHGDAVLTYEAFKDFNIPVDLIRVKDGEEAMTYLKKEGRYGTVQTPAFILLDLNLPRKNGLQVLEEVKNDPRLEKIPVMVLTSSNSHSDVDDAYKAKANFYMVKPFDLAGFQEAMKYVEEVWLTNLRYYDLSEKNNDQKAAQ